MRVCPICGEEYDLYPALSRRDNRTEICPSCGMVEALEDFVRSREPDNNENEKLKTNYIEE